MLTCWFGLKLGVWPTAITPYLKKKQCIDFNYEMALQLTLYHPYLSLYFQNLVLIISEILYQLYHSQPSATSLILVQNAITLKWKVAVSPLNQMRCTKCPITLLYFRPRSCSAGPSLISSLAGQRYLSASQEFSLTAVYHISVHKLITHTILKQCALQLHIIKRNITVV